MVQKNAPRPAEDIAREDAIVIKNRSRKEEYK